MSNTVMKYGQYRFLPAPLINKTVEYTHDAQSQLIFTQNSYHLTGYLLFPSGDFGELMLLREAMENALASGNQNFLLTYGSQTVISGYPTIQNVSFEEGVWVQQVPYSIDMIEEESSPTISGIKSYSENWSFAEDETMKNITVEHTISAQGLNTAGTGADNSLDNAKTYVLGVANYGSVPASLPAFCQGSGTLTAYESLRTENASEDESTYEVSQTFILCSGSFTHISEATFDVDENGGITVGIDGTIQGLGRGNRWSNALAGWQLIEPRLIKSASGVYLRNGGGYNLPVSPTTQSIGESTDLGTITYSYSYTDTTQILPSGITDFEISKDITEPVGVYASHVIVDKADGNVIQDLGTSTEGTVAVTGRAVKLAAFPMADLKTYINTRITALAPVGYGTTYRVTENSYSVDETGNVVEFNVTWTFTAPAYSSYLTYL
jgi:hypothetical protein